MILSSRCRLILSAVIILAVILPVVSPPATAQAANQEEELFLVAQKAFDDGFYDVAIRYIEQFLQKYPKTEKFVQAKLLLGQCYFFKSQYLKAFDTFQSLLSFTEFKDATLFWLGETYYKGGDYKQAESHYRQVIDVYPDSTYLPQAFYSLGWTYFDQHQFDKAKQVFLTLTKKFPVHQLSEDAAFKVGECEYNLGKYEAASQYFQNYLFKYPQSTRHAEAYFYIAESYYYQEDYLTAITYYAKAADIAYDAKLNFMAKVSMGWCYLKLGKYELSEKSFLDAQDIADEKSILSDDIYLGKASLYTATEKNDAALEAYEKLIEGFPNSPRLAEAHLGKANIHYVLKDYPNALKEYQWIVEHYGTDPHREELVGKAYYGVAWTHLKSGDIDRSIQTFEMIFNKTENKVIKVSALTQIGDAYQDVDQFDKAIDVYDRILKDYPDSIYTDYVQFREGIALLRLNKVEAATLSFQSLQTNFPGSKYLRDVKYYLGLSYYKKEDWAQASRYMEEYLSATSIAEVFAAEATYILALSEFNLGNYDQAIEKFHAVIKNYPEQPAMSQIAELNIAKSRYHLGQTKEAIKKLLWVTETHPQSEAAQEALLWLGDHYLRDNDFNNAITYYQKFAKDFPGSTQVNIVRYQLGQAYQGLGQLDEALNQYKLIKDSGNKEIYAKAQLTIADIFSQELEADSAIKTYQDIIQKVPDFQRDAYVKIAGIHEKNKEYPMAIEQYTKALAAPKGLSKISEAELQFDIGDLYEVLRDTDKALENYLKIPYLYPSEVEWTIKAYLRSARIFEDSEDWEQAKTTYTKIIEQGTEESKYAKERIEWIDTHIMKTAP